MWDGRTRRYAILEKKIVFEKNKKNGMVRVFQALSDMLETLQLDIDRWNKLKGVYGKDDLWRPEVKVLDPITHRSKIFEIIGNEGEKIVFGHLDFEMAFSVKLSR